jgi:AGZA family xanthine/uracil permease-like MFS transporter
VLATALQMLPVALPLALATVVGGLQCTASANAAGDPYEARDVLLLDAVATLAGGLCGGVVPTTAYYGHPAYKTMGARVSFPLLTGLVLFLVGYLGWFIHFFDWIPPVVLYAAIVFVGLRTITHGLESVEAKYFAAVLLATVPVLAYLANLAVNLALGNRPPDPDNALFLQTLRGLGNGFILTGLLWAGALVALIDGAFRKAAAYLGVAAGAALLGVIHSPLVGAGVALPWNVMAQLPASAIYQTPYHWAAAYALTAGFLVLAERLPNWKWPARRAASPATPPGPEMPPAEVPPPPAAEPQPTAG